MAETMTPSARIIATAGEPTTITDATGRQIVVKLLRGSALSRFMRTCGPSADISVWFGEAVIRGCVESIDGDLLPHPTSLAMIEGLFDLIDDDAAEAVAKHMGEMQAAKANRLATAKNSSGTPTSTSSSGL